MIYFHRYIYSIHLKFYNFSVYLKVDALYLRANKKKDGFVSSPLGQHTIESYFKDLMSAGGYSGKYTLHSLRRTGASRMFRMGVPTNIIQMVIMFITFRFISNLILKLFCTKIICTAHWTRINHSIGRIHHTGF